MLIHTVYSCCAICLAFIFIADPLLITIADSLFITIAYFLFINIADSLTTPTSLTSRSCDWPLTMEKPSLIVTLQVPAKVRLPMKRKQSDDDDNPDFTPKRRRGTATRRVIDSTDEDSDSDSGSTPKIGNCSDTQPQHGSNDTSMAANDAAHKDATHEEPIREGEGHDAKVDNKSETDMITEDAPVIATPQDPTHGNSPGIKVDSKVGTVVNDGTHEDVCMGDVPQEYVTALMDAAFQDTAGEDSAHGDDTVPNDATYHEATAQLNVAHSDVASENDAASEEMSDEGIDEDVADVADEGAPSKDTTFIGHGGKWRHPAIKRGYKSFRQTFLLGPDIFYQPFTYHGLGGFQAIIQSMAAQHPDLPIPKLTEFAFALKRCSKTSLKTRLDQPYKSVFGILSASKMDGQGNWEPDCFNDDTRFLLQDHLALVFYMWQKDRDLDVTLAIWNNGAPWAYKVWERDGYKVSTDRVVWIYHDGLTSYAGLGNQGTRESIKGLEFKEEELEAYSQIVQGAGTRTARDYMQRVAAAQQSTSAETSTPAEQSDPDEPSVAAEGKPAPAAAEGKPAPAAAELALAEGESAPAEQAGPVEQSVPDMQLATQQSSPAATSTPAERSVVAEGTLATTDEEPVPAEGESAPTGNTDPVEQSVSVIQLAPVEGQSVTAPVEQPAPVDNTVTADQPPLDARSMPTELEPPTMGQMALVEQLLLESKEAAPIEQSASVEQPAPTGEPAGK